MSKKHKKNRGNFNSKENFSSSHEETRPENLNEENEVVSEERTNEENHIRENEDSASLSDNANDVLEAEPFAVQDERAVGAPVIDNDEVAPLVVDEEVNADILTSNESSDVDSLLDNEMPVSSSENVENETITRSENVVLSKTDDEDSEEHSDKAHEDNEDSEEQARKKAEKEKAKKERKAKRKAWVKAHKFFIAVSCLILLVLVGVMVGHFVSTVNMIFIHSADDLMKAAAQNKKSELKFKSDVTIDGDLTLNGYLLDMDKYTLTVNGDLTIKNEKIYVGKQKYLWSDYENGGKIVVSGRLVLDSKETRLHSEIVADNIIILGESAIVSNTIEANRADYADIWFNRNENTESVLGAFSSDSGVLTIDSKTTANVHASMASTITLNGEVNEISGGEKVFLKDNSKSAFVRECSKLYISGGAVWGGFDGNSVENHYFVQTLATPELIIEKTETGFELHISHVDNADAYIVLYEGLDEVRVEKNYDGNYTVYVLPTRDPASYKLTVYAVSNNPDEFNDGDKVTTIVDVYSTLSKPQILSCEKVMTEQGEQYILTIKSVANALSYEININGKKIEVENTGEETLTIDVTSLINGVGTYNIRVTSHAKGTNYKDSQEELYSFINTIKLALGEITEREEEGKFIYSWENVEGAAAYEIVYGDGKKIVTTDTSITLDEKTTVRVRPLGKGYYKDGDFVSINESETPDVSENPDVPDEPEIPETPEIPEESENTPEND